MDPSAPGWYPDPYGRHERRYWSGIRWSRHVDDRGYRTEDPVDTGPVATVPILPPPPVASTPGWPEPEWPAEHPQRFDRPVRPQGPGSGERYHRSSSQIPRVELPEQHDPRSRQAGPGWVFESDERRRVDRSRRRRPFALIAGAVVLVLIAGAAVLLLRKGDDDGTAPEEMSRTDPVMQKVVAAIEERALGSISEEKTQCMAEAVVSVVGKERLIELDVLNGADPVVSASDAEKDVGIPKAFECLDNDELVAFMAHSWRDENDEPFEPPVADCMFRRWLAVLGRERLVYLYRTFANLTPPPLQETLNANEYTLAIESLQDCMDQFATNASTTVAP